MVPEPSVSNKSNASRISCFCSSERPEERPLPLARAGPACENETNHVSQLAHPTTLQESERARTTIPFQTPRLGGQTKPNQPLHRPRSAPRNHPSSRRNAHRNARISSTHFPSSHLTHPYPQTHVARRVAPARSPARPKLIQSNGSRIPATEFPTIGPAIYRRRPRITLPDRAFDVHAPRFNAGYYPPSPDPSFRAPNPSRPSSTAQSQHQPGRRSNTTRAEFSREIQTSSVDPSPRSTPTRACTRWKQKREKLNETKTHARVRRLRRVVVVVVVATHHLHKQQVLECRPRVRAIS